MIVIISGALVLDKNTAFAASGTDAMNVTVNVVQQVVVPVTPTPSTSPATSSPSTSGGGGSSGLRRESLIIKMIDNTTGNTIPRPTPNSSGNTLPQEPIQSPNDTPSQNPDTPVQQSVDTPKTTTGTVVPSQKDCVANPFAPGCNPAEFCTLGSIHCIVFGVSHDLYLAGTLCVTPIVDVAMSAAESLRSGLRTVRSHTPFSWTWFLLVPIMVAVRLIYFGIFSLIHALVGMQSGGQILRSAMSSKAGIWYAFHVTLLLTVSLLVLFFLMESL